MSALVDGDDAGAVGAEAGMYLVTRKYANTRLIEELIQLQDDIRENIGGVPGFRAYYLVRTRGGGMSVTVCEDREGVEESSRLAAKYLRDHLPDTGRTKPELTEGEVILALP